MRSSLRSRGQMTDHGKPRLYRSAGVIPFRSCKEDIQVLLITAAESAEREAWEEAGVVGRVRQDSIGNYAYRKWGGICFVEVRLMEVEEMVEEWPESERRKRQWMNVADAAAAVEERGLKKLIADLPALLSSTT